MEITHDESVNAAYIRLSDGKIAESEEVLPGVIVDCDENDQVVGIELLGVTSESEGDE